MFIKILLLITNTEICLPGTFYEESKKSCELCPLSQYQDKTGQASCMACPNGKITRSQGTSSVDGCIGRYTCARVYSLILISAMFT